MKNTVMFSWAMVVILAAAPAHAEPIPDFGKDMQKSRRDDPENTKNQVMVQQHHYKTMKMKRDEMARKSAGSGAPSSTPKRAPP